MLPVEFSRTLSHGEILRDLIRSAIPENADDVRNKSPAGETTADEDLLSFSPTGGTTV